MRRRPTVARKVAHLRGRLYRGAFLLGNIQALLDGRLFSRLLNIWAGRRLGRRIYKR